ncbi:uncharacterized protein LOC131934570 [Physella acuta]|uniref:uncharacterized protein LOC131934570 n=1 Tax=Physella acuta TaxID=109671 RepID=UPI0027DDFA2D|nr:uncharacterized protein LOC131934570 [Physella acuta]
MEGYYLVVLTRVILDRMKEAVDLKLREEQAGFRKERSCTDQIATLRIIVEQTIEWQAPLYICFVDFEKTFDSVDRQTIWNLLRHYGFQVNTGVRQVCLLSPLLFLVVLDWVTRTAYASFGKGIQRTLTGKLEDLEFVDDLALLSHRLQDMKEKVDALGAISQRVGLKINKEKTEVMRINNN